MRETTRVADLLDESGLRDALRGVQAVCHLAGLTRARESTVDPLRYFRVNTGGAIALLDAMAATGVARIVFASTGSIYGTPERQPMTERLPDAPPHPYAASKLAAESAISAQARTGRLSATVLRLTNVAGGADPDPTRLIPRAFAAAVNASALEVNGDGSTVRDYLHVVDAAAAFVACVDNPPPDGFRRYIIGSGHGSSVRDVVAADRPPDPADPSATGIRTRRTGQRSHPGDNRTTLVSVSFRARHHRSGYLAGRGALARTPLIHPPSPARSSR
jgi:UDP-glucose 4-epimerase